MNLLTTEWFFRFVNALFESQFLALFLSFSLIYLSNLRKRLVVGEGMDFTMLLQIGLVLLHWALTLSLYIWTSLTLEDDAVVNNSSGLQVMFYLVSALFAGVVIWVVILCITIVPSLQAMEEVRIRFMFVIIPISVLIGSIALGVFTGSFGLYGRTSAGYFYYFTLYALFVFLLVYGTWPVRPDFGRVLSENTAILSDPSSTTNPFSNAKYFEEDEQNFSRSSKKETEQPPLSTSQNEDNENSNL